MAEKNPLCLQRNNLLYKCKILHVCIHLHVCVHIYIHIKIMYLPIKTDTYVYLHDIHLRDKVGENIYVIHIRLSYLTCFKVYSVARSLG